MEPRAVRLLTAFFVAAVSGGSLVAQPSPGPRWAGWARCEIKVTGTGYVDQQTHTWTITGDTPSVEGAFRVFRGTWSVAGGGSLERTQGTQTLRAQWTTNGSNADAPIAVFVRASDNRAFVQARHAQLRVPGGITGSQQVTIDGKPHPPMTIGAEAFEWSFPVAEVSRPTATASAVANGSSTPVVNGRVGLMQPAGTQATASCSWQFSEGSAPTVSPTTSPTSPTSPTPTAPATPTAPTTAPPTSSTPPTTSSPPSTPSSTTGSSVRTDLFTTIDADPKPATPAAAWWPPGGTANYTVELGNAGPAPADGATATVPAAAGLTKTVVTCTALAGARCPVGLTVAQLESGVPIPTLPANGYVRIAFSATVTGALGSSVTVVSKAAAPAGALDTTLVDNQNSKTHAILVASTSSSLSKPASPSICLLPGPVVNPPVASPTRASLTWAHINGATYTVSRNDVGLVTPAPITSAVYPATVGFNHDGPLYFHTTYVYTVVATYGRGCGSSQVSIAAPRPFVPVVTSTVLDRTGGRYSVFLTWKVPADYWTPNGDNDGWLVLGAGLPVAGYEEQGCWKPACIILMTWTKEVEVSAGEYSWIVSPYWNTPSGRMIDVSSGARITVRVP